MDKRELIKRKLEGWRQPMLSSIEHFAKDGRISGSLLIALLDMLEEYGRDGYASGLEDGKMLAKEMIRVNSYTITNLMYEHTTWARETFGERTPQIDLEKLIGEAREAQEEPCKEEFADILLCLLSACSMAGVSSDQLFTAAYLKLEKNKARKWAKNEDGTFSHIK